MPVGRTPQTTGDHAGNDELARLLQVLTTSDYLAAQGRQLLESDEFSSATALLTASAALQPDREDLVVLVKRSLKKQVARWHFRMMNDATRNDAFRRAVHEVVKPGDVVLDVGSGAGLTAMMAAAAGAEHVYSCEQDPLLAALARNIIADNGFAKQISVLNCSSEDLAIGRQLPRFPDAVVGEVFDCALLGEGALGTFSDVAERLMSADTRLVPRAGTIYAQLVESRDLHELNHVSRVCGFDLSGFNLVESADYFATNIGWYANRALTDPFAVMSVEFGSAYSPTEFSVSTRATASGVCHAVVMWFVIDLTDTIQLSSGPYDPPTHWRQGVQTFRDPAVISEGSRVDIGFAHDCLRLRAYPVNA